jgi:hypothetical protein
MLDTTIITEHDLGEAVRSTAMLADVSIAVWGAERSDNKLMDEVKANAGAVGNVGRVVKNLLAGADSELKEARSAFAAVRSTHYAMTLPWVHDLTAERMRGPRLLPNMLFEKYLGAVSTKKREANAALDAFIHVYPDRVQRAKANLGGMADLEYPTPEWVKAQFRVSMDFEPIPSGSAFRGLPEHFIGKLASNLKAKQDRMIGSATAAMWEQVHERVAHVVDRLGDPENKFKGSTIESVRELIELIPGWDVTADPRAAEITEDIKRMLSGVDAKALRDNVTMRQDVAEQAAGVVGKLAQWGL